MSVFYDWVLGAWDHRAYWVFASEALIGLLEVEADDGLGGLLFNGSTIASVVYVRGDVFRELMLEFIVSNDHISSAHYATHGDSWVDIRRA